MPRFIKKTLLFLILLLFCPAFSQNSVSTEDVKKEADRLFEDEEFTRAYKLYAQLVSNFPKDVEYNYRLGVCMIYSEPDKKKSLPYLKAAVAAGKEAPKDAQFYLGKAYHINYLFDDAIKCYTEFKKTASSSRQKKLQVDREIAACNNGKHLLSNLSDLVIQSKKQLNEADYFRSYDLKSIGGKLLVKPEDFKTSADKKKKEKSVVFLPKGSNVVYFSSYGDNPDNGKDIYTVAKLPNGTFDKPQKVSGINTEFDEDYPFLHPDGKTLYFASKGFNSMGGYDIFKSVYNEETRSWSTPVNLEFPINSPDDDYLFVTDSLEKTAYFSTGRQSPPGKIDVLKINTERKPLDVLVIKGKVIKENAGQSLNSVVTVKKTGTEEAVGTFSAAENGDYSMELPNGANLVFTVETPGLKTQSGDVALPMATTSKPYKQTIAYENGILKIINQFDEAASDSSYLQYLKVIEKKAKLDVNEGQNKLELPTASATNTVSKDQTTAPMAVATKLNEPTKPEVVEEQSSNPVATTPITTSTTAAPKQNLDNKQLAAIARQDAEESLQEAGQMERDSKDAYEVGQKQKADAQKKLAEANSAITAAEALTNADEKKEALEKATALKTSAEGDLAIAEKILTLSRSLGDDAQTKRKEAQLNNEYATELERTASKKNNATQSLAKLEDLQKQITETSGQKNESAEVMNALKTDIEDKEKQLADAEKASAGIKTNLDDIKVAVISKEIELAQTRKKAAKQELTNQINDLKAEQTDKEKQLAEKDEEIKKINEQLISLKSEQDLANKIKTEDIAANTPTIAAVNNALEVTEPAGKPAVAEQKISNKDLQQKYKDKTSIADPKNTANIEESTSQLKNYNKEIDQAIARNKTDLAKAKTAGAKQQLNTEIKQLENTKKQNQQFIASNNKLVADLAKAKESTPAANASYGMYPVTANTPAEAVKSLDQLNTVLNVNENDNFDFNDYQNPQAQSLKVEADSKINDAIAQQKKLKELIAASRAEIQNNAPAASSPALSGASLPQLNKEAEDLQAKATELRNTANTKTGTEKEKLMNDAKALEEQSNDKYLQAAAVTKNENSKTFNVNNENVDALIKENKSSPADVASAKQLNEEAATAFKKAVEIRQEAQSLTSKGAMLGSMSNAEEKEAEAVLKQQQAIDLLKNANPGLVLKTPAAATPDTAGTSNLRAQIDAVNKNLASLVNTKIESYQKLYEANNVELEQLTESVKKQQTTLDNTPSLKTDYLSSNSKAESAKTLRSKADESTNATDKLNSLIAAIKKQNEAIKQTAALNASLEKAAATTAARQQPAQPVATTSTDPETPASEPVVTTAPATTTAATQTPAEAPPAVPSNENAIPKVVEQLAKSDTTSAQVVNYFNTNAPELRNQRAGNQVRNSLMQLRNAAAEEKAIDEEIVAIRQGSNADPAELKSKAESLLSEAEQLSNKASENRKEADTKTGEEKDNLLARAKSLEAESQSKTLESANLTERVNEANYQSNATTVTDLLARLKTDNPTLYDELNQKNSDLSTQHAQARELRGEANAMDNTAARLGAISNAEEKEIELMQKQDQLVADLKKQYPDYVAKKPEATAASTEVPENLKQRKKAAVDKQSTELTNLTNAFTLEYESSKNAVPKNLNAEQQVAKQNAETLNAESKRLLIRSAQEKDPGAKIKQLTLAAKAGDAAVNELKKLLPATNLAQAQAAATPAEPARATNEPVTAANNPPPVNNPPATNTPPARQARTARNGAVKLPGLEIIPGNAYNVNRPIPVDAKIEDGLVFRVQIGAFKVQLPNDAFKGLSPLNAETTHNGYYRYTAGNFTKFEVANAVKNDLRGLGYSDAFVVGYYNGKRISISEALALLSKEGKTVDIVNAPQTAGITANANVPQAVPTAPAISAQDAVTVTKELEKSNGLLYTIQVGVYGRVTQQGLLNLKPIFSEKLPGNLFRYTAGIYNNTEKVINDKRKVVDLGIKDAFVSAYLNGKRIPFADAKARQESDASIKMEAENPIIFPGAGAVINLPAAPQPANTANATPPADVKPFSNGVNGYPAATPDNGIKTNEEGVTFKVQVGAYSKQVPADVAEKFSAIKTWPVENKFINGLFIYNIGNFAEAKFAKTLKEEAIRLGLTDAFITVYKDGKKLYGAEATQYMSR